MLSVLCVAVNCGVVFFTSNSLSSILPTWYSTLAQFMTVIAIEHGIIGFKLLMSIVSTKILKRY